MLLLLGYVNRFFATEAAFALCSAARSQRSSTMVDGKIKDAPGLSKKAKGAAAPAPDERDAAVERLERAVAEERQHATILRKTVEELRFKARILEKSYAKQLEDARLRESIALLDEQHGILRGAISTAPWSRLSAATGGKRALVTLAYGIAMHDVYHAGQIRNIKALFKQVMGTRKTRGD